MYILFPCQVDGNQASPLSKSPGCLSLQLQEVEKCKKCLSVNTGWWQGKSPVCPVLALSHGPFTPQTATRSQCISFQASDYSQPCYTLHSCWRPQTVKWAGVVSLMKSLILRRDTKHLLPTWRRENLHKQFPKSLLSIIRFVSFFLFFLFFILFFFNCSEDLLKTRTMSIYLPGGCHKHFWHKTINVAPLRKEKKIQQ